MKICVIQPRFSMNIEDAEKNFNEEIGFLESCDESMDIIVMPEGCDVLCNTKSKEDEERLGNKYKDVLLKKASETAKRCNALVFANVSDNFESKRRNTTIAFNRDGEIVGKYYKQHLTPKEMDVYDLDSDYTYEFSEPTTIKIDGIKFGFLTCYDFYFYEMFPNIARQNVDVIIGCSQQKSDEHYASEIMSQFLAYNTNAYVIRASVSLDENSNIGGASMVVAPNGKVLFDMKSKVGIECIDVDIEEKYYKPAGYGNPPAPHYEYIEKGRRPWKYRPAGSAIVKPEELTPYPRMCAHRGFPKVAPENSLAAFGAAVALGADEIEFDLWPSADKEIVSVHDENLERLSNGSGKVHEHTFKELKELDFGIRFSEDFKGLSVITFEDILKKFACHTIMNIHIKTISDYCDYDKSFFEKIVALIDKYDCRKYVYFMASNSNVLRIAREVAPDIPRCCGYSEGVDIVDEAVKYGCKKIQLFKPYFDQSTIDRAHENNIICNLFWSDDPEEAKKYLEMGIDNILTNDYYRVSRIIK